MAISASWKKNDKILEVLICCPREDTTVSPVLEDEDEPVFYPLTHNDWTKRSHVCTSALVICQFVRLMSTARLSTCRLQ